MTSVEISTLPAMKSGRQQASERRRLQRQWIPIYPIRAPDHLKEGQRISNALPIDWICPSCDLQLNGNKTCLRCGRSPMDNAHDILNGPQHVAHTQNGKRWRKFGRRLQC